MLLSQVLQMLLSIFYPIFHYVNILTIVLNTLLVFVPHLVMYCDAQGTNFLNQQMLQQFNLNCVKINHPKFPIQHKKYSSQQQAKEFMENSLDDVIDKLFTNGKFLTKLTDKIITESRSIVLQKSTKIDSNKNSEISNTSRHQQNDGQNSQLKKYVQGKRRKVSYEKIIQQLYDLIRQLIDRKMEQQMVEIIEQNNKILNEIRIHALQRQNTDKSNQQDQKKNCLKVPVPTNQKDNNISDASFNDIKKMINEQLRKLQIHNNQNEIDAQKSFMNISATYEKGLDQKLNKMQKKLVILQDRYETNFKSVWNVLSMTESFVHQQKENISKMIEQQQTTLKEERKKNFLGFKW